MLMSTETRFRNLAFVVGVIALASLGGLAVGLSNLLGLYFLIGLASAFIFVLVLTAPDVGILLVFMSLVVIDIFRRIMAFYTGSWDIMQLLAVDVVVVTTLISLYLPMLVGHGRFSVRRLSFGLLLLLGSYIFWIIVEVFNPTYPDINLIVIGIRTYLWPVLVIGVGWYVVDNWDLKQWKTAFRVVFITLIGTVVFGLFIFLSDPTSFGTGVLQAVLQPAEHAFRSWQTGTINLVSSVFASSKRFGRFLLMMYPFLWIYLDMTGRHRAKLLVAIICTVGCFISGSREALFLIVVMYLLLESRWSKVGSILPFVASLVIVAFLLLGPGETQERFEFTLSTTSDWTTRIQYMVITPVFQKMITNPTVGDLFGVGAGRYGQGSLLYNSGIRFSQDPYDNFIGALGLPDAGLYKIFIELGFIGLILFLAFHMYVIALPWRHNIQNPYLRASAIALIIWFILFMKTHTVINDQIMTITFWFYVGLITGVVHRGRTSPAVQEG